MVVGIMRLEINLPGSFCLKDKRRILNSLRDRIHAQFRAAVAETGHQEIWNAAEVGVAVVSNERRHAAEMLDAIRIRCEARTDIVVEDVAIEFWQE
jgi:uncharacterized protein YlxP (DUF503 family)